MDGIYLRWNIFLTTIYELQGKKRCHFAKQHKPCKKDVEHILCDLHNMIIKDEHVLDLVPCFEWQIICMKYGLKFEQYAKGINEIEISNNHFNLKDNLVKQLRVLKGGNIIANGIQ